MIALRARERPQLKAGAVRLDSKKSHPRFAFWTVRSFDRVGMRCSRAVDGHRHCPIKAPRVTVRPAATDSESNLARTRKRGHPKNQKGPEVSERGQYRFDEKNILRTENKSCTLLLRWPFVVGLPNPVL
jgi:hypothetical protein